jgi:hypothetical protein
LSIRRSSGRISSNDDEDQLVVRSRSCLKLRLVVARAADSPPSVPATAGTGSGGKAIVEDDEFSLAKVVRNMTCVKF